MALTIGNKTNVNTESINSTTYTFAHNNNASTDAYLFVKITIPNSTTISGVTYNGVAMTQLCRYSGGANTYTEIWYLANPASGSNNTVITFSSVPYAPLSLFAISASGCDGAGNYQGATYGSTPSGSITVSANSMIFMDVVGNEPSAYTIDGSSRSREYSHSIYNGCYGAFSASGLTSGSKSFSTTVAGQNYLLAFEIKEKAAAARTQRVIITD